MLRKLVFLSLVSASVFSQSGVRPDQCFRPGEMIGNDLVGTRGVSQSKTISRSGTSAGDNQLSNRSILFTNEIFDLYSVRTCDSTPYTRPQTICRRIEDPREVLGKGNSNYRSLFVKASDLQKAAVVQRAFTFRVPSEPGKQFSLSDEAALYLAKYFSSIRKAKPIPTSYQGLIAAIEEGAGETQFDDSVQPSVSDELVQLYIHLSDANISEVRNFLGFKRVGNLDVKVSYSDEALRILAGFQGASVIDRHFNLEYNTAYKLNRSFSDYLFNNPVEGTYDYFKAMMKNALDRNVISASVYNGIVVFEENETRELLGMEVEVKSCKVENVQDFYNKVNTKSVRRNRRNVSNTFSVSTTESILLNGEEEDFTVTYDGVTKPSFNTTTKYNSYTFSTSKNSNVTEVTFIGKRKQIDIRRTAVSARLSYSGGRFSARVSHGLDKSRATYKLVWILFEKNGIFDKRLGEGTTEIDSTGKVIIPVSRSFKRKKHYIKYQLQVAGSQVYKTGTTRKVNNSNKVNLK